MSVIQAPLPTTDPLEDIPTLPNEPEPLSPGRQLIKKALDVWSDRGWTAGRLMSDWGQVCAIGALDAALLLDHYKTYTQRVEGRICSDAYQEAVELIAAQLLPTPGENSKVGRIILYNDVIYKSYSSMRGVFEQALES